VLRGGLTAIALTLAAFPALVVLGGFLPNLPVIGRFGIFIGEGLPWIGLGALAATVLAAVAARLRGGLIAAVALALTLATFVGSLVITGELYLFAAQHGTDFSILRQATSPPLARQPDGQQVFATIDGQSLRADIWQPPSGVPNEGPNGRTAVMYVHGGSFVTGGLGARPQLFEALADRGFVVLDIEYRLAPPPRWADAPADVLCALAWLRGSATGLGIDPERVFVMGESAGGSLALVAGYAAGTAHIAPSCPGEPIVPEGVIAVTPAADLAGIWSDRTAVADGRIFPEAYIGGPPTEFPDRYEAASPFRLLRPSLPRTLLIGGANDHLVLPVRVTSLAERFTAAGVDCELVMVPFAEHGFDGVPNGYGEQLEESIVPGFLGQGPGAN
jgi:acetyl esterase/lipase